MKNQVSSENFEKILVENSEILKHPTIFFLLKSLGFSEHYIKNLRKNLGAILLNDKVVTIREKIKNGDIVKISKNPYTKTDIFPCEGKIEILFEDEDFLIVNKPHNLSCMPNRSHFSNNLGGQICKYMQEKDKSFVLRVVNRLDKETAGIVVVSKNVIASNNISLYKEYHAICHGEINAPFTINKPIQTITNNGINQLKRVVSSKGKPSISHVTPIKTLTKNPPLTIVKVHLETGRTHQIRVHLSDCTHPLVADTIYGVEEYPYHTMLLLKKISFTHFRTNKLIEIEVPYPSNWISFID